MVKRSISAAFALFLIQSGACFALEQGQVNALVQTIIQAESSGRPHLAGDNGNSRGLMQISKEAWKENTRQPWHKAYDPALNRQVGTSIVKQIIRTYRTKYRIEPTAAHVVYRYNTGRYKVRIPKGKWTIRHKNRVYRAVYGEYFKNA